jgi:hypothetical protein
MVFPKVELDNIYYAGGSNLTFVILLNIVLKSTTLGNTRTFANNNPWPVKSTVALYLTDHSH